MRTTQVYIDNNWIDIDFRQLKTGDKFRLYDENDILVKDKNNESEFTAISDSYMRDNILTIDIEETGDEK